MASDSIDEGFSTELDADWDESVSVELTVGAVLDAVFAKAGAVHSGGESCVDPQFVIVELTAHGREARIIAHPRRVSPPRLAAGREIQPLQRLAPGSSQPARTSRSSEVSITGAPPCR